MHYSLDNFDLGSLIVKFMDLMDKFISYDINRAIRILSKYTQLICVLQKTYPDVASLKCLNNIISLSMMSQFTDNIVSDNGGRVNLYIPKVATRLWSPKQLEPFINKLQNRENFDGVISVLQELDAISQRQSFLLAYFVDYFHLLLLDSSDIIRDLAFSLTMRFLRLNPKESYSFYEVYCKCLNNENSAVFQSAIKVFPDFTLLCSEKSQFLLEYAFNGSTRHNIDVCKQISDAIRILNLEKYIY